MKKLGLLLITSLLLFIIAACGSAEEGEQNANTGNEAPNTEEASDTVTVKHELGETDVPVNPENVVVFDFGILDTLDKLGINVAGVAQAGTVPSYLEKYASDDYTNIGSLKEPDLEAISSVDPELIIISGRQAEMYEEFSKIAPTIHLGVDTTRYMESFKENMAIIGEVFDKQEEIDAEIATIEESIAAVSEKATDSGEKGLIILANDDKISAYGANSRFGIIHDVLGVAQADENIEASTHGMNVTFEYVVEQDPDILYVVDRAAAVGGETSAPQLVENELVENTKAFKNDKIVYLNPEYWYLSGGGLVSVAQMVQDIDDSLN
ncbi:siderophore ABC transporter substrate-binding protein [Oceanobacillus chungangensis]|uniref:ABC transporter n=1 Tax=Oceanobacillus chungangensis TaxID=1229152 RepID=A0A3D8PYM3_9BACI|nr:siderophore ABC transporter substrate-binding protein [Oceanobacillus chungangensis]RDW21173.1 ABC transporter [Oceanobacillus chungangensis]